VIVVDHQAGDRPCHNSDTTGVELLTFGVVELVDAGEEHDVVAPLANQEGVVDRPGDRAEDAERLVASFRRRTNARPEPDAVVIFSRQADAPTQPSSALCPRWGPEGYTDIYTSGMAKVMVSLPDELLADIDDEAQRRSISRSALLAEAARRDLSRRDPRSVASAIRRSLERFEDAPSFEAASLVRDERDRR